MSRTAAPRKYGKKPTRSKAERLFAELPQSPVRKSGSEVEEDPVKSVTERLLNVSIDDSKRMPAPSKAKARQSRASPLRDLADHQADTTENHTQRDSELEVTGVEKLKETADEPQSPEKPAAHQPEDTEQPVGETSTVGETSIDEGLRILTWDDVCPPGDQIIKIAEASYAEVYRVTNERGTSIIKVIRLESPIKPQTKAQIRAGLVDEQPHSEVDIQGELQISEWLADIPGFVVYKERYIVQGKATRHLLETHQTFQKKMKRRDPGRAQFYPSPSRYLDGTKFLVVELGDAGRALEDWKLTTESQLWDIFFLEAIALARAEDIAMFEVGLLFFLHMKPETDGSSIVIYMKAICASGSLHHRERGRPMRLAFLDTLVSTLLFSIMGCLGLRICR